MENRGSPQFRTPAETLIIAVVYYKSLEAIRGIVLACLAALALGLTVQASAHGPEPHEETAAQQNSQRDGQGAEPGASAAGGGSATALPGAHDAAGTGGSILSNLHPASVHFPVALLILAALIEALNLFLSRPALRNAVDVMAVAGGLTAAIAAALGWVHTGFWFGGEATMQWHRWMGTGMAVLGLVLAALVASRGSRLAIRLLLAVLLVGAIAQGYLGGELAHGPDHLLGS